ncbi:hypothetical protein HELRODRAFT_183592 [Helobdella robusta]|uniref:Endonuclease/exonuclease/phosphatase domain-containing protein n=1 Tax=Helobdella robusta TaxID=6412 RepID=T1FJW4_HELRO|nr:hypothetical protein HELRODRAFT_183592 [Helobdella robusta]ESO10436.1 hypothetical protein HELRODRAFT_183592 [Helobdella robusta]
MFFNLMHLNIRSLVNKTNELESYLSNSHIKFNVVAITESWLNERTESLVGMDEYRYVGKNRHDKNGGGVGFYVCNDSTFRIRDDLNTIGSPKFEMFAIEIINNFKSKNSIVMVSYRPPIYEIKQYFKELEQVLQITSNENKFVYLLGDLNIDLSPEVSSINKIQLNQLVTCYNLKSMITVPTRISNTKKSTIDILFTNHPENIIQCGTLLCDLSDHIPLFACTNQKINNKTVADVTFSKYSYSTHRINNLNEGLCNADWTSVLSCDDVDVAFQNFIDIFRLHYKTYCSVTSKRQAQKMAKNKPWITKEFKQMLKRKKMLYKKYLKHTSSDNYTALKSCSKLCNKIKCQLKRQYYFNLLQQSNGDSKKTWSIINSLAKRNNKKTSTIQLTLKDDPIDNPETILNNYFINLASDMQQSFVEDTRWKNYLQNG